MNSIVSYVEELIDVFGAWSIAVVASVFVIMLPINTLIRLLFAKLGCKIGASDSLERVRKTVSSLTVFAVSAGVLAAICPIIGGFSCSNFVWVNCVPVGACAMLFRAVYKLVRDNCVLPLLRAIEKHTSTLLENVPVPEKLKSVLYDYLTEKREEFAAAIGEGGESKLITELREKLTGFCSDADRYAVKIVAALKKSIK